MLKAYGACGDMAGTGLKISGENVGRGKRAAWREAAWRGVARAMTVSKQNKTRVAKEMQRGGKRRTACGGGWRCP